MQATATYHPARSRAHRLRDELLAIEVPQTYDGLTPAQFSTVVDAQQCRNRTVARARILIALLGISWRTPRRYAAFWWLLTSKQRAELLVLADPFLQTSAFKSTLVPTLRAGLRTLHAAWPDLLNGMDTETWGMCDTAVRRYRKTNDMRLLSVLASLLYALPRTSHDDRLKGASANMVKKLTGHQLQMVLVQFIGHRMVLEQEGRDGSFSKGSGSGGNGRKRDWVDVMLSMSDDAFGDYNAVRRTPIRVFLRKMGTNIVDAREALERMKRRK